MLDTALVTGAGVVLVSLVGYYCWFLWTHRALLRVACKLPIALPTLPLFGHAYVSLCGGLEALSKSLLEMAIGVAAKEHKAVCFWCGPLPLIILRNVEDIQVILNGQNTADKPDEYEYFTTGLDLGNREGVEVSLLTAKGFEWKVMRRHMNPLFHPHNIQHLVPMFNRNSQELVCSMTRHLDKGAFNVMEYTMNVGLKSICNLLFGPEIPIDVKSEAFRGLMTTVERIPELFMKRLLCPWLRSPEVFKFLYRKELQQINKQWVNFTEAPLKRATENILKKQTTNKNVFNDSEEKKSKLNYEEGSLNFLDCYNTINQSYPQFSNTYLRSEMVDLYCTGSDSIGTSTAACLLALAQYQDIQERLYNEILSVVGMDEDVTMEHLNRMPYLDQVFKETLRRFTIVPFVLRKVTKDVQLSTCKIPAGSTISCGLAAIHLDPKIYPNPHAFHPDRFSPENSAGKEKYSYIPFSGGPRSCIGKIYATQLFKTMIVHVLRKFRLSTTMDVNNFKKKLVITLISADGYNISIDKRK